MKPHGDFELGDKLRVFRVFDVENRSSVRRIHVAHVAIVIFDHGLPAAGQVDSCDLFDFVAYPKFHFLPP
jgi:hypothetical protein